MATRGRHLGVPPAAAILPAAVEESGRGAGARGAPRRRRPPGGCGRRYGRRVAASARRGRPVRRVPDAAVAAVPHAVRAAPQPAAAGAGEGRGAGGGHPPLVPAGPGPAPGAALRGPVGGRELPGTQRERAEGEQDHAGSDGGLRGRPPGPPRPPALPEPRLPPRSPPGAPPRRGADAAGRGEPGDGGGHHPGGELRLRRRLPRLRPAQRQRRPQGAVCPRRPAPAGVLFPGRHHLGVPPGPGPPGGAAGAAWPRGRGGRRGLVAGQRRPGLGLPRRHPAPLGPRRRPLHPPRRRPRRGRPALLRLPAPQQQPHRGGQRPAHGASGQHLDGEGGAGGRGAAAGPGAGSLLRRRRPRAVGGRRPRLRLLLPLRPQHRQADQGVAGGGAGGRLHHLPLGARLGQPRSPRPLAAGQRLPRPPPALQGGGGGRLGGAGAALAAQFPHAAPGAAAAELLLPPHVLPPGGLRGDGQRGRLRAFLRCGALGPGHGQHPAGPRRRRAGRGLQLRREPAGLQRRHRHRHRLAPPARLKPPRFPPNPHPHPTPAVPSPPPPPPPARHRPPSCVQQALFCTPAAGFGSEKVLAARGGPALALDAAPGAGGAPQAPPRQPEVGVHAGALGVHRVHCGERGRG